MTLAILSLSLLLLVMAAWLRAAGTAITRVPRADALRDQSDGVSGASTVVELLNDREIIAPAVGVVSSGLLLVATAFVAVIAAEGQSTGMMFLFAAGVGIFFFLVGDLVPRWLGRIRPRRLAYSSHRVLRVAVGLGGWANDLLPDKEEFEDAQGESADDAPDEHERELIDSVLEFAETIVREVMTPRPDMITISVTGGIEELIDISTNEGYSRVPVTSEGDVVGMVIVKDLLSMITDDERPSSVAQVMRPVDFVPENKLASALLAEMQESHTHQMIVVDEFGDVVGLVTIEDLLEELVGEIADETDSEEEMVLEVDGGWHIDARLPVDDLSKMIGLDIEEMEADTVGGLLLALAERVPEEGETFELEGRRMTVLKMQGRRVSEVRVT